MRTMPALTLHQPYAGLIAEGRKVQETRDWPPPRGLVGRRIAIHAAKKRDRRVLESIESFHAKGGDPELRLEHDRGTGLQSIRVFDPIGREVVYALGAVVATARLAAAWRCEGSPYWLNRSGWVAAMRPHLGAELEPRWVDRGYGFFDPGRWVWELEDVVTLQHPIQAWGHRKVWTWYPPEDFPASPPPGAG